MNSHKGIVATFIDETGTERKVHMTRQGFKVKRETITLALALNQVAGRLVGKRVREFRHKAGLSMSELCIKAGIVSSSPKQRIHEIEVGSRKEGVRLGTLYCLAEALGVEAAELLPTQKELLDAAGVKTISVSVLSL